MSGFDKDPLFAARLRAEGDCILWCLSLFKNGYGQVGRRPRKLYAHRYAWELVNGPIPDGMQVNHLCRNRCCVAIPHLYLGTQAQNMADKKRDGTDGNQYTGATHCIRGHAFSTENTIIEMKGGKPGRSCRTCRNVAQKLRARIRRAQLRFAGYMLGMVDWYERESHAN